MTVGQLSDSCRTVRRLSDCEGARNCAGRRNGDGLRPVVLPLAGKLFDVLEVENQVRGHEQPSTETGQANVEGEAVQRCARRAVGTVPEQESEGARLVSPVELPLWLAWRVPIDHDLVQIRVYGDGAGNDNPQDRVQL